MAKGMRMVTATHRHCCAMPGCGNRTYTYFTRRDNPSGAIWLCGDCVQAMNDIICPPAVEEAVGESEATEERVAVEEAVGTPKPRKSRGKNA